MEKIKAEIHWEDKNYSCGWALKDFGAIICTAKSLDAVKSEFEETLKQQVFDMVEEGEDIPEWLERGDYYIVYSLAVSALLRQAEQYTTMAAISRVTGINQKQLSHYASSLKTPRPAQRERILNGLHAIGQHLLGV